tara:strand:- start:229 stop:711 length:483 start_codon:yes stop_codon:yes gene_type:complete
MEDPITPGDKPIFGYGMFFEDFSIGKNFRTLARTVTEADLVSFIGVTGMTEVLFTDVTFKKGVGEAGRVVPAALSYTLMEGLLCQTVIQGTGLALLELHKKIIAPVVVGDTLYLELQVLEARPTSKGGRGIVKARHNIINQKEKTVITYEATRMIAMRNA